MAYDNYEGEDQDDYNSYTSGNAGYDDENWDKAGFTVEDASSLAEEGDAAGDAFFAGFTEEDPLSADPGEGMATTKTILQGRLMGMDDPLKSATKKILDGTLDPTKYGLAEDAFALATTKFNSVTGEAARAFTNDIHAVEATPITHLRAMGRDLKVPRMIQPTASSSDVHMAMSMLSKTSEAYLAEGPGLKLQGIHVGNEERRRTQENDLEQAFDYVAELSDLYIRQATKDDTVAYEQRFYDVNEALTERLMQGHFRQPDDRGPDKSLLPTPNDLYMGERRITGLVPTFDNSGMSTALTYKDYTWLRDETDIDGKSIPNLRKSLFKDVPKIDSYNLLAEAYEKAQFATDVFRKQFPTNRDDSARQKRHAAHDTPYGEQSEAQDLRNEAAILGKDTYQGLFEQGAEVAFGPNIQMAARSGGMYGEKEQSESEDYVQAMLDPAEPDEEVYDTATTRLAMGGRTGLFDNRTDRQKYQDSVARNVSYKQNSPEWFAQREGLVTGSVAEQVLRKNLDKAVNTVLNGSDFKGSSYSIDGNDSEGESIAAFLGTKGKGLQYEEAFFEAGQDDLAGLAGVSPDGRLFNQDGSTAGLLELKYLTDKSAKNSRSKHIKQMQMQMLVTGEAQTHYFVRSSDTGKHSHELILADPHMQKQLREGIIETQRIANNITPEEIEAMAHRMRPKKVKSQDQATMAGPEALYTTMVPEAVTATVYRPNAPVGTGTVLRSSIGSGSAGEGGSGTTPPIDPNSTEDFDDAVEGATQKLQAFGAGLQKAVKALGTIADVASAGNATAMSDERLASEVGLGAGQVRGMRDLLVKGGMTEAGVTTAISNAGALQGVMNDNMAAPGRFTSMLGMQGASSLPGVSSLQMPNYGQMQALTSQGIVSTALSQMDGKTNEERAFIAKMWGMPGLASTSASGDEVGVAFDTRIDPFGARSQYEGMNIINQEARDALEIPGTVGTQAGMAAATAEKATGMAKFLTAMGIGGVGAAAVGSKGKFGAASRSGLAKLSSMPKFGPLALAAIPSIVRGAMDQPDDDGWSDSVLDVAEFTGLGVVAGIPGGPGGMVMGGVVGATIGLGNELMESRAGRINPPPNIATVMQQNAQAAVNVSNEINVDVLIAEDMVKTVASNNGEDFEESVDTVNTGG